MKRELLAALSSLFEYPAEAHAEATKAVARFHEYWSATAPGKRREIYVETFDFSKEVSLYLTYAMHGDTRERGVELARLKAAYRSAGLCASDVELPDYLPLVLDFCANASEKDARAVLTQVRTGIEVLRRALHTKKSPYALLADALCAELPRVGRDQRRTWERAEELGPPAELVGR